METELPLAQPYDGDDVVMSHPRPLPVDGFAVQRQTECPPAYTEGFAFQHKNLGAPADLAAQIAYWGLPIAGATVAVLVADMLLHGGKRGHTILEYLLLGGLAFLGVQLGNYVSERV